MTTGEGQRRQVGRLRARHQRWEERVTRRVASWSISRRWTVLVLLPALMLCCGGTAFGAPLSWVVGETLEAGKGAIAPDAAVNEFLMALSAGDEDGLLPVLDDEDQDELLALWRGYRRDMERTDPRPSRLDFSALDVGPAMNNRAEASVPVAATWWKSTSGFSGARSEALEWRFHTRQGNGWVVSRVEAPAWCGGYVPVSSCR